MNNNTTKLLSAIVKAMSEEGIEVTKVEIYEEAVDINNKVKICILDKGGYLVHRVHEGGGERYAYKDNMLARVLHELRFNDWLPGDDIEAYGEWFTLVVEQDSFYTEANEYCSYRLLDENYALSERMTLEDLKNNYTNVRLEQDRLK